MELNEYGEVEGGGAGGTHTHSNTVSKLKVKVGLKFSFISKKLVTDIKGQVGLKNFRFFKFYWQNCNTDTTVSGAINCCAILTSLFFT